MRGDVGKLFCGGRDPDFRNGPWGVRFCGEEGGPRIRSGVTARVVGGGPRIKSGVTVGRPGGAVLVE